MGYKGTTKYTGKFKAGQKIARWTIVSGDIILQREAMVEATCECGNTKLVSAYTIYKGVSTGCKECQNASYVGSNNPSWKGIGKVPGYYFSRNDGRRKMSETNKKYAAELIEQQEFKCALTGLPISFTDKTASLDRTDSTKPYKKGNIQWVHKDANVMKNGYNLDYFIKMCKLIAEQHKDVDVKEANSTFIFGNTTNH
jgi:hypothetical protein